jgi:UDP-2-acetamido-2,6-beta-L-arabino-hexul-4-ose reductase
MRIGITGQSGFIGFHLYNTIKYCHKEFELIEFNDEYFQDDEILKNFLGGCDVLIHLAALNRHNDSDTIYKTNVGLVEKLTGIMSENNFKPYVLFASSIQEYQDNPYGRSKKAGRMLFEKWAKENESKFTALILPNIYGAFGVPFYNSVISTFSYQLTHGLKPKIEIDNNLNLLYVSDLANHFVEIIKNPVSEYSVEIPANDKCTVTELLEILNEFGKIYFEDKLIPRLNDSFRISLFNTFRSYIEKDYFPVYPLKNVDERGFLSELIKTNGIGQVFYSVTKPGITRGNHFHRRKMEKFIVLKGNAVIKLRKIGTKEIIEYPINGSVPAYVDMPIYYTHNIENTGKEDLITLFWSNEFFSPQDPDTYFEKV